MSKPITVLERKPVETELVEREYTYEELLELFPDGGESIVNPLVRRCQEYEAEIERLQNENQGRMEEGMSKYSDLDMMIDFHDPKTYIDGCKCDPDVNYTCELCMTYNTLREAKRMLLLRDTEIERLQSAYDGLTPAQYHAGLSKLWTAIGNQPIDGRDVFTLVADEIVALKAIITAKLHQRKCHDCGHVGWYADSRTPYCLCDRCRSQDTRLVKEEK